jgi:hypothetical protein
MHNSSLYLKSSMPHQSLHLIYYGLNWTWNSALVKFLVLSKHQRITLSSTYNNAVAYFVVSTITPQVLLHKRFQCPWCTRTSTLSYSFQLRPWNHQRNNIQTCTWIWFDYTSRWVWHKFKHYDNIFKYIHSMHTNTHASKGHFKRGSKDQFEANWTLNWTFVTFKISFFPKV